MAYLLQWVMMYSFDTNTDFENRSQFNTMAVNGPYLLQWTNHRHILENTDLGIDPNSTPYIGSSPKMLIEVGQLLEKLSARGYFNYKITIIISRRNL